MSDEHVSAALTSSKFIVKWMRSHERTFAWIHHEKSFFAVLDKIANADFEFK
jgi:hypothetical protein